MDHSKFINTDMFFFYIDEGLPTIKKCRVNKIIIHADNNIVYYVNPYMNSGVDYRNTLQFESFNIFESEEEAVRCFNEASDNLQLSTRKSS